MAPPQHTSRNQAHVVTHGPIVIHVKELDNSFIEDKTVIFCGAFSDILCANPDGHKFLMQQRSQKYNDLHHAVKLLRYVHEDTPIGKVFLKMYLVESGQIKFEQYKVYHTMSFNAAAFVVCTMGKCPFCLKV